jgi:hypothetical protein
MVYVGTATRTIYGIAIDKYLSPIFRHVSDRWGVPLMALVATTVVGWFFLIPLPSWYQLVGIIMSATVLTYIMGGIGLQVFRRTAPQLHRPFRLKGAAVLSPIGFIAATLIIYWSGESQLNYIVTLVILGLAIYGWLYGPNFMGINRLGGLIAGILMVIAVLVTGYFGPLSTKALSFIPYFILLAVETLLYSAYIWLATERSKRHDILASAWFFVLVFGIYLVSHFGAFGPFGTKSPTAAPIPFPRNMVVIIIFSLIIFYWVVASGYKTQELTDIIQEETSKEATVATAEAN